MDISQPPNTQRASAEDTPSSSETTTVALDLTGGPFAVIESDPGEFEIAHNLFEEGA
jgi:hypothetical protein